MPIYKITSYEREQARWDRACRLVNGFCLLLLVAGIVFLAVRRW